MRKILGTPQFVAPELVGNGVAVDIWVVDMMIFDLLTAILLFTEEEVGEKSQTEIEFNKAIKVDFSRDEMNFTKMLLCMDVNKRLSTMGALCHSWLLTDLSVTKKD